MKNTAVMIWAYNSTILDVMLSSLVKFIDDSDIYLIDAVERDSCPNKGRRWQPHLKDNITRCLEPYKDRIKRLEWGLDLSYEGGGGIFKRFIEEYPYEYYLKTDDDIIYTDYGLIPALKEALELPDALVATGITPVQKRTIPQLNDILGLNLSSELLEDRVVNIAMKNPDILKELWDKTFPPNKILPKLKAYPTRYLFPQYSPNLRWSSCYYLIKHDAYLSALSGWGKWNDEGELNKIHRRQNKKIVVDTHHLVYHYSWQYTKEWTNINIKPLLMAQDFWK